MSNPSNPVNYPIPRPIQQILNDGIPIGRTNILVGKDPVTGNYGPRIEHPINPAVKIFFGGSANPTDKNLGASIGIRGTFK